MRNVFIYFFIAAFVFSFGFIERFDGAEEVNCVEKLLNKRIEIINEFLYAPKNPEMLEKLKNELAKIEAGKLLKSDIDILTHIYDNPTDYERTKRVKINEIKEINVTKTSIDMLATLEWKILSNLDLPIESSLIKDYNINCIFKDKKIYLTGMEFVD